MQVLGFKNAMMMAAMFRGNHADCSAPLVVFRSRFMDLRGSLVRRVQ
ncbi:hypothetical protein BVRB_5g117990 [Beta vulgaris subsp. vulgaris]|nr:hypothetical protein BVRB_5g117990 [Beta vulgaris subsp. vulgaris]